MKPVEVIERDFKQVSQIRPEWKGYHAFSILEERKIYVDTNAPRRTTWGRRVCLEHERAHFLLLDAGVTPESKDGEELFCDWMALVRTPNKELEDSEMVMKRWVLDGFTWAKNRESVILRVVQLSRVTNLFHAALAARQIERVA